MSDFPEFDKNYDAMLLPDDADRFNHIAAETRFNIYNSPIWRVQGRKFAEAVIRECAELVKDGVIEQQAGDSNTYTSVSAADIILEHFGIEEWTNESNIAYINQD